jgi:hypothetical protein
MKFVSMAAILMCGTARGASPNPMIGKWKLAPAPPHATRFYASCASSMVYTETTQTLTFDGKSNTDKVTYLYDDRAAIPSPVYVRGNAGHTTYRFLSKDRVELDTGAGCQFLRSTGEK